MPSPFISSRLDNEALGQVGWMFQRVGGISLGLVGFAGVLAAQPSADPERGAKVYKKCMACHMVGPEARNRVGPPLNDLLSARAGHVEGFRYSDAMRARGDAGLTWTEEALDAFLADPRGFVPKTKMSFRGLKDAADRADVIAYLATFSQAGTGSAAQEEVPVAAGFAVSDEILSIEGDVEYGAYLGSECTTCHQQDGGNAGIPGIVGWETDDFVTAMHAYKEGHRANPVMQMVTGRLANDEIAALAAYFKSLGN